MSKREPVQHATEGPHLRSRRVLSLGTWLPSCHYVSATFRNKPYPSPETEPSPSARPQPSWPKRWVVKKLPHPRAAACPTFWVILRRITPRPYPASACHVTRSGSGWCAGYRQRQSHRFAPTRLTLLPHSSRQEHAQRGMSGCSSKSNPHRRSRASWTSVKPQPTTTQISSGSAWSFAHIATCTAPTDERSSRVCPRTSMMANLPLGVSNNWLHTLTR